jgi:hypothetical protein
MTLKENLTYNNLTSSKLEIIADEFAIGFAEWILNERTGFNRETEIKELLEIYKKEKGL